MRSAGDDLINIDVADSAAAQALANRLRAKSAWLEVVPGIRSVVVQFDISRESRHDVERRISDVIDAVVEPVAVEREPVEIAIEYGGESGPDLDMVCDKLGLTSDEFVALHAGVYTVEMLGFTPGFAYIGGLDDRLNVGRLPEPRLHLPAGSVGIAGGRTGLYSLPGPGGWPIIGRTRCSLFDAKSDRPFTLDAGMRVEFTVLKKP